MLVAAKVAPLSKGQHSRQLMIDAALALAAKAGLEGLTIGAVAEAVGMSKSGVFAHFGSREELQISVIRAYHERFEAEVFVPALKAKRGLPRLRALFANWVQRVAQEIDSGCIHISGAVEFDDRPGVVREALVAMVRDWHAAVEQAVQLAVEEKHLWARTDAVQLRFEILGLILALHFDARFMKAPSSVERARKGFERLIKAHRVPIVS